MGCWPPLSVIHNSPWPSINSAPARSANVVTLMCFSTFISVLHAFFLIAFNFGGRGGGTIHSSLCPSSKRRVLLELRIRGGACDLAWPIRISNPSGLSDWLRGGPIRATEPPFPGLRGNPEKEALFPRVAEDGMGTSTDRSCLTSRRGPSACRWRPHRGNHSPKMERMKRMTSPVPPTSPTCRRFCQRLLAFQLLEPVNSLFLCSQAECHFAFHATKQNWTLLSASAKYQRVQALEDKPRPLVSFLWSGSLSKPCVVLDESLLLPSLAVLQPWNWPCLPAVQLMLEPVERNFVLLNCLHHLHAVFLSWVTRADCRTPRPAGMNSTACLHRPDSAHAAGRQLPSRLMALSHDFTLLLMPIMSFWKMQGSGCPISPNM